MKRKVREFEKSAAPSSAVRAEMDAFDHAIRKSKRIEARKIKTASYAFPPPAVTTPAKHASQAEFEFKSPSIQRAHVDQMSAQLKFNLYRSPPAPFRGAPRDLPFSPNFVPPSVIKRETQVAFLTQTGTPFDLTPGRVGLKMEDDPSPTASAYSQRQIHLNAYSNQPLSVLNSSRPSNLADRTPTKQQISHHANVTPPSNLKPTAPEAPTRTGGTTIKFIRIDQMNLETDRKRREQNLMSPTGINRSFNASPVVQSRKASREFDYTREPNVLSSNRNYFPVAPNISSPVNQEPTPAENYYQAFVNPADSPACNLFSKFVQASEDHQSLKRRRVDRF